MASGKEMSWNNIDQDQSKPLGDRLNAILAERERKLQEIRRKAEDPAIIGRENQEFLKAQSVLSDLNSRMKRMAVDSELPPAITTYQLAKNENDNTTVGTQSTTKTGSASDEINSLYEHMLSAFRNWKPPSRKSSLTDRSNE